MGDIKIVFTFHYVSTYTVQKAVYMRTRINLHSTMFLLIRSSQHKFHHDQIDLHSTMFLLIRSKSCYLPDRNWIYIPLCFYLYPMVCL